MQSKDTLCSYRFAPELGGGVCGKTKDDPEAYHDDKDPEPCCGWHEFQPTVATLAEHPRAKGLRRLCAHQHGERCYYGPDACVLLSSANELDYLWAIAKRAEDVWKHEGRTPNGYVGYFILNGTEAKKR